MRATWSLTSQRWNSHVLHCTTQPEPPLYDWQWIFQTSVNLVFEPPGIVDGRKSWRVWSEGWSPEMEPHNGAGGGGRGDRPSVVVTSCGNYWGPEVTRSAKWRRGGASSHAEMDLLQHHQAVQTAERRRSDSAGRAIARSLFCWQSPECINIRRDLLFTAVALHSDRFRN